MNERRRYLTHDCDEARVELVVVGPAGNADYDLLIVPEGGQVAWLADVSAGVERVALGPHATVHEPEQLGLLFKGF